MSECEIPQYYTSAERKARKAHECCECGAPILLGEEYLQVNACWEGKPKTYRQHQLCAEACMFVRDKGWNDDECIYFGGLDEFLEDYWRHERQGTEEDRRKFWRMILGIKRRERKSAMLAEGKIRGVSK